MDLFELLIPRGESRIVQRDMAMRFRDSILRRLDGVDAFWRHEKVIRCEDENLDMVMFIAVHNTVLGPSLGGCRVWDYSGSWDPESAALEDVLILSEAMSYKSSAARLPLGGGKAVLLRSSGFTERRREVFRSVGKFVEYLNGVYIAAEDVGATVSDMDAVFQETRFVSGISEALGGGGNSAIATGLGVFKGIVASCEFLGLKVENQRIGVQGACGNVASALIPHLVSVGASLTLCDLPKNRARLDAIAEPIGARVVEQSDFWSQPLDILSPCALGGVINDQVINRQLGRLRIIAGAANNQLEDPGRHDQFLYNVGVLYAPDFVINAGGIISLSCEPGVCGRAYDSSEVARGLENIPLLLTRIFFQSKRERVPTGTLACTFAKERIRNALSSGRR